MVPMRRLDRKTQQKIALPLCAYVGVRGLDILQCVSLRESRGNGHAKAAALLSRSASG